MQRLSPLEIWFICRGRESRSARELMLSAPRRRPVRKLDAGFRARLIDVTASVLRRGEPTVFAFEGAMRTGIRARLCLKGWGWDDADLAAEGVVAAALNMIGAERPDWREGQLDFVNDAGAKLDRVTCAHCGRRLPDGKWKFCSTQCTAAYHSNIAYHQERLEREATEQFTAAIA